MTEADWLACADPVPLLEFLRERAGDRKLRLFAAASYRVARPPSLARYDRGVVGTAERMADRLTLPGEVDDARAWAGTARRVEVFAPLAADVGTALLVVFQYEQFKWGGGQRVRPLLHDVFGNPLRPVSVNPDWLTSSVLALAEGIYADRAFDRMPVLADALEDAGCGNTDILTHCRSDAQHVRGCWVVDLLLGKE